MSKTISIVVPVYFNEGSLFPLFEKLKIVEESLIYKGLNLQLIFVDDGSEDNSLGMLLAIKQKRPETKIIKLTRNFGAVHASKQGFKYVLGDCFMALAADLQDPPELIIEMVDKWLEGSKFVLCERISREDPLSTKFFAAIFYWLMHKIVMKDYPERGYDMALMDKSILPHMINSSKNLYTPLLAYWLGYKPTIIFYNRLRREHGESRWTFRKKFKAFLDVILGFSATPIRIISVVGVATSIISFIYGLVVMVNALLGNIPVPGFAALATLVSFLLGLIILMIGIIAEYIWRIFDEVNHRPEVVVDEIY